MESLRGQFGALARIARESYDRIRRPALQDVASEGCRRLHHQKAERAEVADPFPVYRRRGDEASGSQSIPLG
jgi:hypothetical protein